MDWQWEKWMVTGHKDEVGVVDMDRGSSYEWFRGFGICFEIGD